MKDDFIYIHPLDFHPESAMTGTLGMRTRATRDEKQVCGKRPILVQVCTWDCSKSKNKDKDCCVAKRKHQEELAKWEKCVQDVRAYNLSVATSPESPSSPGNDSVDTSQDVPEDKPETKTDTKSNKSKDTERVQVKRPELDIVGNEKPSNTKIIIFSVIVVLAILATFVGYLAFKKN